MRVALMRKCILSFLACVLTLIISRPALSTTYNYPGTSGAPTDLNGWVGGVDNLLIGSNLQVALPFLHNPVNVLTGTYTGCTAGVGSGCVKGTGRTGTDGTWSSGTTFTSASGSFTSGDTGKSIWIVERNLDALGVTYTGTVIFVNPTTLTLSSTPSFSGAISNAYWVLGVDDGPNLLNAIGLGDVLIPAGTYVTATQVRLTTNYHNIQCQDGAILINPQHTNSPGNSIFAFLPSNYSSIIGCNLQGTNVPPNGSTSPGYDINTEFNFLVSIGNSSIGDLIQGNHFAYGWANSELILNSSTTTAVNQNVIINNFFEQCGHYGTAITEGNNNVFEYNRVVDCDTGSEANSGDPTNGSLNTGNIYRYNQFVCVNGDRGTSGQGCMYLSGGNASGVNYGGNQVLNNSLSGCGSVTCSGGSSGVHILQANAPGPAVYTNNQCGSGCSVH
jgi:hypothetical protein